MSEKQRDVSGVAGELTPVQALIRKWSQSCGIEAHDGQWDCLNELISAIVQTERDRAAEVIAHYAGRADQAERETTRAEKAETERDAAIRQLGQTAAECGRAEGAIAAALRKAEHDLAEAVEGLKEIERLAPPVMESAEAFAQGFRNEPVGLQDKTENDALRTALTRAAFIIAKHTPPRPT